MKHQTEYPTQPRRISTEASSHLHHTPEGGISFCLPASEGLGEAPIVVPAQRLHDLVMPTMLGLLEDLTPGSAFMDQLLSEWQRAQEQLADPTSPAWWEYGEWFYYPADARLARFAPLRWHRLALQVRNATLLSAVDAPHDWPRARAKLDKCVLASAGCSVGSNILHSTVMLIRPAHARVADVKDYHLNNANRVRLTYRDFGRNKALVCAEQLHAVDPYLGVTVYESGLDAQNVEQFVAGATVVIETTDDISVKYLLRKAARDARVPLVMATDLGSAASIDVRRFDLEPSLQLVPEVSDARLAELVQACERGTGERSAFVDAASAFSGHAETRRVVAFREIMTRTVLTPFGGIPQLGSTAAMAGGMAAWVIAQIHLGHPVWERMFFDPATGFVECKGVRR